MNFRIPESGRLLVRCLQTGGLALLCGVALCVHPAGADELHLTDGRVVTGKVVRDGDDYVITFDGGAAARFTATEVVRLDKTLTARERYENLKAVTADADFDAQMELGKWCRLNLLPDEAKEHFRKAAELRPDDAHARRAAGFIQYDGKWVTREEALALQGRTIYKGQEMTIAEAEAKKQQEEQQRLRSEGYTKAWRILQGLDDNRSRDTFDRARAELTAMGALAMGAVLRSTDDGNPRVRALCLELLAADSSEDARKELFARLRYEETPDLVRLAAKLLAGRPERELILAKTLEMCIHSPSAVTRRRTWLVLRYAADKRVLPPLLDGVEYCPVPEEARKVPKKDRKAGEESSSSDRAPQKPYYPACDALNYLTGSSIPPKKEMWQNWWKTKGESFDFKTRGGPGGEETGDPEKKDSGTKEDEKKDSTKTKDAGKGAKTETPGGAAAKTGKSGGADPSAN